MTQKTVSAFKWSAIERIATQSIQLVIILILGRLLGPEAFGLVAMLAIFISICNAFVDSGFSSALIRKVDRNEEDYSTTFYFNILVSLLCYCIIYITSPFISSFYETPELSKILRILALSIIINSFFIIQRAKLTIKMDMKTQAKVSLISVIISSIVSLSFAYYKLGVWSLVAQTLSFSLSNAIFFNLLSPWRPTSKFSVASFKELFGFGNKILLSTLLTVIYDNMYGIIIGKMFNANQLGYFTQANKLAFLPSTTLTGIIQKVTYPMMSNIQNDSNVLNNTYILTLRLSATIIFPILTILAISSKPIIIIALGLNWINAADYMFLLCLAYMLYPIHAINLNLLQVKGRSDLFLRLEVIKKILTTVILIITIPFGIKAICIGILFQSYISLIINTYYTERLLSLNIQKQISTIIPIWLITLFCGVVSWYISSLIKLDIYKIISIGVSYLSLYFVLIKTFENDLFMIISSLLTKKEKANE
ncbi:lipopolysaccharide biosynthesis protein [Providencia rettgeri]|nr:lipopolysaccharide biosynthesis protein [Providencia rettgeri]